MFLQICFFHFVCLGGSQCAYEGRCRRSQRPPGAGAKDYCEPHSVGAGNQILVLCKKTNKPYMLLTTEPFLQPPRQQKIVWGC